MRASRMIYEDGTSLFDVLLEKDMYKQKLEI